MRNCKIKNVADHVFDMVDSIDTKLSKKTVIDSLTHVASLSFLPSHQMIQMIRTQRELKEIFRHDW